MGGLFSGLQERRTDALVRLAYDIKQVKLNIAANQSRRRKARLYTSWMYLLLPGTIIGCMVGFETDWWMAAIFASPLLLLIVFMNYVIKWHYNRVLKNNQALLATLKSEKRKVLEEIKNTENYAVAKELLDKFDNSDEETDVHAVLIHGSSMA